MTKLGHLKSIGHNISDSVSSGVGLMVGIYGMDIYDEAATSKEGYIDVDFISGNTSGGAVSASLARAMKLYSEALLPLCERHGINPSEFQKLNVRFFKKGSSQPVS